MDLPKNLDKRVTEDTLSIGGRVFKLKSYDPLEGNYLLIKLFTTVLPFGVGDMIKQSIGEGTEMIPSAQSSIPPMTKADFLGIQRDILMNVYEVLPGGESPVVRENGTYGIENFTSGLAIQLIIASITFNYKSFFEEVPFIKQFMQG